MAAVRLKLHKLFRDAISGVVAPIKPATVSARLTWSRFCSMYARMREKWEYPTSEEVKFMEQIFLDPRHLISQIHEPLVSLSSHFAPQLSFHHRERVGVWQANLQFVWPTEFTVSGRCWDQERAVHFAYLNAAMMYQHLGILNRQGKVFDYKNQLLKVQDYFPVSGLTFKSTRSVTNSQQLWVCHCYINAPLSLEVTASGLTQQDAEQLASAEMFVKLKACGYLRSDMTVLTPGYTYLPLFRPDQKFEPDYVLTTDASIKGYGAYLRMNDTNISSTVRWIYDEWAKEVKQGKLQRNSSFMELYAVVGAIYTWKKKFEDTDVLLYSDSLPTVLLTTCGMNMKKAPAGHAKLFQVLKDTCAQYKIRLHAVHLPRESNQAADHLSRNNVDQFREMVPEASIKSKKPKKLLFFLPFCLDSGYDPPFK